MSDNNKDLIMVDFADRDPRSFKANLRGTGDGRHQLYAKIVASMGTNDLDALHEKYGDEAWARAQAKAAAAMKLAKNVDAQKSPSSMLSQLIVPVVGISLGIMFYQVFIG